MNLNLMNLIDELIKFIDKVYYFCSIDVALIPKQADGFRFNLR